jgi:HPt (histidine-containing phosphotransfer) domain-containing protein
MAAIAARALDRNRERAARLRTLVVDDLDAGARQEAVTLAHQIAGSAGTFGHDAASDDARTAMELLADGAAAAEVAPFVESVQSLLADLPD